jgi:hypothetical protein
MTIDTNDILNSILESLSRIDYIHPEDIPNIDSGDHIYGYSAFFNQALRR